MAIDDDTETTVAETQPVKAALVAELTWAKLYTRVMHKDLGAISMVIRESTDYCRTGNDEKRGEITRSAAERESHCRRTQRPCRR